MSWDIKSKLEAPVLYFLTPVFQQITSITINDENAAFRDFVKTIDARKNVEDWTNQVVEAFERLVPESIKKQLNVVKKREVDAIRR